MALPRASSMRSVFRRSTLKGSGPRVRTRFNQHISRRTYASGHGSQKASSDLPWLIGSIVVTVPSAAWLWAQGPTKGEGHGHGDHEKHAGHEEGGEEESKDEADESDEKPKDDKKDDSEYQDKEGDGADGKAKPADEDQGDSEDSGSVDGDDKGKDTPPTSDDEGGEDKPGPDAPNQMNNPSGGKRAGETSKGSRSATEKKGEKDAQGDQSGAKHPSLDDPEKSKKAEGLTDTAKIHGTVSVDR